MWNISESLSPHYQYLQQQFPWRVMRGGGGTGCYFYLSSPVQFSPNIIIIDIRPGYWWQGAGRETSDLSWDRPGSLSPHTSLLSPLPQTDIRLGLQSNNPHQQHQAKLDLWVGWNPRNVDIFIFMSHLNLLFRNWRLSLKILDFMFLKWSVKLECFMENKNFFHW